MNYSYHDFTNYNDGKRGGKVRVRAKINIVDKENLITTTKNYLENKLAFHHHPLAALEHEH